MNEKRPTIRAIAEKSGYSKSTVSMALRDDPRLSDETRRHVQMTAKEMGYQHNPVVAHLMAQLSQSQKQNYKATLAVLNIDGDRNVLDGTGTVRDWVTGCERRAGELGYRLDRFWLNEPGMTSSKLKGIFRARNITGVLIINSCAETNLPEKFASIWDAFSCLVVGNRIIEPALNFVCNDQYITTLEAVKKVAGLGYKRPGLVMCEHLDEHVELKFSGGFQKGHELMFEGEAVPVIAPAIDEVKAFDVWLKSHKPDVIIAINDWPEEWVKELNKNIALVSIDYHASMTAWSGMDQNNELIGAVAVEQLIGQLHRNEIGIPPVAKCVLIESTWRDGANR